MTGVRLETSRRLPALDGLRALAVLLVIGHHADQARLPGGFVGVDLFFALSGYLISSLLLAEYARDGRIWFGGFFMRRALRLAPALVVLVLVVTPIALATSYGHPWRDAGAALFYLMDLWAPLNDHMGGMFAHTWSLAVEEQFYLAWPVVLLLGLRHRWNVPATIIAASLALTLTSAVLATQHGYSPVYRSALPHVAELGSGALLALALGSDRGRANLAPLARGGWIATGVVGLVIASRFLDQSWIWLYTGGFFAVGLFCAALVAGVVLAPSSWASQLLSATPAVWLGQRSYGIYLWHYPALLLAHQHFGHAVAILVGLVATLAATVLSWELVERPFLRRKVRYQPQRQGLPADTNASVAHLASTQT